MKACKTCLFKTKCANTNITGCKKYRPKPPTKGCPNCGHIDPKAVYVSDGKTHTYTCCNCGYQHVYNIC